MAKVEPIQIEKEEIPILTLYKIPLDNGKYGLRVRKHHDCDNDWELASFLKSYLTVIDEDNLSQMEFYDE